MFHKEQDHKEKDEDKEEKPKAGCMDKIKIKLGKKNKEDFAEEVKEEEEVDYETMYEQYHSDILEFEGKYSKHFKKLGMEPEKDIFDEYKLMS
jgi:hypothetical protein